MQFELSEKDHQELRKIQKKKDFHPRRYRKVTVLIMLHQGHSVAVIEAALGMDDNTIRRDVKGYQKRGLTNYLTDSYIPFSGKLSEEQEKALCGHLDEHLYEDAASVCAYVYDIADSVNAQSTQRLCRKLLRKHPRKTIYLLCDNARYNRNKMLQNWAKDQRIEFVFLPPYSPNLNLIERLWRLMRKKLLIRFITIHIPNSRRA